MYDVSHTPGKLRSNQTLSSLLMGQEISRTYIFMLSKINASTSACFGNNVLLGVWYNDAYRNQ